MYLYFFVTGHFLAGYFWYRFFLNQIKCRGSIVAGYNLPNYVEPLVSVQRHKVMILFV